MLLGLMILESPGSEKMRATFLAVRAAMLPHQVDLKVCHLPEKQSAISAASLQMFVHVVGV